MGAWKAEAAETRPELELAASFPALPQLLGSKIRLRSVCFQCYVFGETDSLSCLGLPRVSGWCREDWQEDGVTEYAVLLRNLSSSSQEMWQKSCVLQERVKVVVVPFSCGMDIISTLLFPKARSKTCLKCPDPSLQLQQLRPLFPAVFHGVVITTVCHLQMLI